HARDYVDVMWRMLQQPTPEDYVIATGEQHSVREFLAVAARRLGIELAFEGEGDAEVAKVVRVDGARAHCKAGDLIAKVDPRYYRPTEVQSLLGDASKARTKLGWTPTVGFEDLVHEMADADYVGAQRDSLVKHAGFH